MKIGQASVKYRYKLITPILNKLLLLYKDANTKLCSVLTCSDLMKSGGTNRTAATTKGSSFFYACRLSTSNLLPHLCRSALRPPTQNTVTPPTMSRFPVTLIDVFTLGNTGDLTKWPQLRPKQFHKNLCRTTSKKCAGIPCLTSRLCNWGRGDNPRLVRTGTEGPTARHGVSSAVQQARKIYETVNGGSICVT